MRRFVAALFTLVAPAAMAPVAMAQSDYAGAAKIIHQVSDTALWPGIARLDMRIAAIDSTHRRAHIEFKTAKAWADTGIASRWGDTLIAATTGEFGDTTIWLGVWNGRGYAGRYIVTAGASAGRYGKWAVNLLRGQLLAESAPPPLEFRKSIYGQLAKNRRGEARLAAGLSFDRASAPVPSSSDAVSAWFMVLLCIGIYAAIVADSNLHFTDRLAAFPSRKPKPNPPGGYAVPCPFCGIECMQLAKKYHVVRGFGVFTRIEIHIIAGCTRCVQRNGLKALRRAVVWGPWSLGGVVATPFVLLLGAFTFIGRPDSALVESLIRNAGLDPLLVKMDEYGVTLQQQRSLDAVAYACTMLVWARGERAPKAFELSMQHLRTLCGGRFTDARLAAILNQPRNRMPPPPLDAGSRASVLRLLRALATADGEPSRAVFTALMVAGQEIGNSERELNVVVQELMAQVRENAAARARAEAAEQAREREYARARAEEKARAERQARAEREARDRARASGSTGGGQHSRPPRRGRDDLDRARSVLGVTASAGAEEIQRAYRANIRIWHPDRAGLDATKVREFTLKAQELTWAIEALRRAAASWT